MKIFRNFIPVLFLLFILNPLLRADGQADPIPLTPRGSTGNPEQWIEILHPEKQHP